MNEFTITPKSRERISSFLVKHHGNTPKEVEDFLAVMELTREHDPEGFAKVINNLDNMAMGAAMTDLLKWVATADLSNASPAMIKHIGRTAARTAEENS